MKRKPEIWLAAAVSCVALLVVGCGQPAKPTHPKTEWVDPSKLQLGPIQHAGLTDDQMKRIKRLQKAFGEVDPSPLEKWVDDFKRDSNPDNELKIWEGMATAYETFTASKNLTPDGKKDVFQVVLLRSGAADAEVLKHVKLKVLTENDAREIMALFVSKPEPTKTMKH
jgi:hypothetical protein